LNSNLRRRVFSKLAAAASAHSFDLFSPSRPFHSPHLQQSINQQLNSGAFIPFIMAGDPDLDTTEKALRALAAAGADAIELGVPYSDPLADGPTIQGAHTRGLDSKTTLDGVLRCVARVSKDIPDTPIVMFTYYNPIMRKGAAEFCLAAAAAGASGLLVPDIPLEETPPIREAAEAAGLELVLLITPTTPAARMEAISRASQGFIYLVSVAGVTGTRTANEGRLQDLISAAREASKKGGNESSSSSSTKVDKPVAVGFGVSGPEQAKQIMQWGADGVIVGSALVRALGEAKSTEEGLKSMEKLAREIRAAIP
jgi:tryptophan synthase alpha chain